MSEERVFPVIVVDATGAVLGRLASFVAKQSLFGKQVEVINCEHAIITGRKSNIVAEYKISRQRGGASLRGPFFPKHADRLVKRTIRGMLHYNHGRGKDAFKRIKCYVGTPKQFESAKKVKIAEKKLNTSTMKVSELSREL